MKLIRFGNHGREKPGMIWNGMPVDLSPWLDDYNEDFFETGGFRHIQALIDEKQTFQPVPVGSRLGPPVARPSKIICIGLNYSAHARESNMQLPSEPVVFFKSTTALTGPDDYLVLPKNSRKTDWEVELAVVIGKKTRYIDEDEAEEHIAGYCLHNDYSEREFQLERGGQWVKGKSCDTFAPMGPWLVSKDEIEDVHNLRMLLSVNGTVMQNGNTNDMIFKVPFLVSYVSQFMTLLPGDIISTGTPAGVGLAQKPQPVYLKAGDVVELQIDGLGKSRQEVRGFDQ
jgi:2,4-diketo-3-deoxy-L-fuconate hydrolase